MKPDRTTAGLPLDIDQVRAVAAPALERPGLDGVELVFAASATGLTRYANSRIIQNTARDEVRIYARAMVGDRVASATTTKLDASGIAEAVERAADAARVSLPDTDFPGLANPAEGDGPTPVWRWSDASADATPSHRADVVRTLIAATKGTSAAGFYETSAHAFAIVSSTGLSCIDGYTRTAATCLVDTGESTGWGEFASHRIDDLDPEALAGRAVEKAERGVGAREAQPGDVPVVLEAPAVATLLEYLSYAGFGGKGVVDGDSFLATKIGEEVAAGNVTIADDAHHPESIGIGFDLEGVPKRRVEIIKNGRAQGPVLDLRIARKLGQQSTGHASGSTEFGPYAANVVLEPGDAAPEDLVAGVDDGLLVTRFHYVNILDRPETLLTGMTRDGTFRIRNGEIAEPVRNLRFTQSVLDALAHVEDVGRASERFVPEYGSFGSTVVAPLRIGRFRFTSGTSH